MFNDIFSWFSISALDLLIISFSRSIWQQCYMLILKYSKGIHYRLFMTSLQAKSPFQKNVLVCCYIGWKEISQFIIFKSVYLKFPWSRSNSPGNMFEHNKLILRFVCQNLLDKYINIINKLNKIPSQASRMICILTRIRFYCLSDAQER